MLEFWSAGNEIINSKKAMQACMEGTPFGSPGAEKEILLLHTTMGHKFDDLIETAKERSPDAEVIGCTGCGVIGRDGFVSEKMRALSVMGIRGDSNDIATSYSDKLSFADSFEESLVVARSLKEKNADIRMILLIGSSLDLVVDQSFAAFEEVFGLQMPVFGWTATDNLKGLKSNQFIDGKILEHGLIAVGFADPSLKLTMGVHHGNECVGEPFVVTRAERNQILEIDGKPAWSFIMDRMHLPVETTFEEALRVVCFAAVLPEALHAEYDNQHVLYVPVGTERAKQSFDLPVTIEEGTKLWLAQRAEGKMFDGLDRMVSDLVGRLDGRPPLAILHSDCAARGRMSFNQIDKAEIIARMQEPLCRGSKVPWLGLYGYGELTRLGGRNFFHNQTTSIYVLTRSESV
jgi:hypothetical protein